MTVRITDEFYFFWDRTCAFSNWHKINVKWRNHSFANSEAAMMWSKAAFFGDKVNAEKAIKETDPRKAKDIGRDVKPFNKKEWDRVCLEMVTDILLAKFTQSKQCRRVIMDTGSRELVEASKFDDIWGIKLAVDDDRVLNKANWKGKNLLGKALMAVREKIASMPENWVYYGEELKIPLVLESH